MIFFYYLSPSLAIQVVLSWQFLSQHQACNASNSDREGKTQAGCPFALFHLFPMPILVKVCQSYQTSLRLKIQGLQGSRKVVFFVVSPFSLAGWKTGSPVRRAGACVGSAFITSAEPIVEGGRCRALPGRLDTWRVQLSYSGTPRCCPGTVSLSEGRFRELRFVS